ncbi:hypothetical protein ACFQHW_01450 [Lapidilactobacillus achengensis]|uniref:Uncharacterized protein n=1 Tax=Lapidilactobacillus achengensis TaxID=2486000 RepID=A0ABW1UMH9_9LACO|nr:hypothetical protein [Lapidilactobacillus achengensis]
MTTTFGIDPNKFYPEIDETLGRIEFQKILSEYHPEDLTGDIDLDEVKSTRIELYSKNFHGAVIVTLVGRLESNFVFGDEVTLIGAEFKPFSILPDPTRKEVNNFFQIKITGLRKVNGQGKISGA